MMGTREEQRSAPNDQPGLNPNASPLAKLGGQIRSSKYKPNAREREVLSKCLEDARWYQLNGALLSSATAWSVSGIGRRLKLIPRIFLSGAAFLGGRDLGGRVAGYSCMKRILALDGSPMRVALISILQEENPDHVLLREIKDVPPSESASKLDDYAQEAHAPVMSGDRAFERNESSTRGGDWPEMLERDTGNGQESRRLPRMWEIAQRKQAMRKDDGADVLADPFDLLMPKGPTVDELSDMSEKQEEHVETRRSRMGAKERREYDRKQYERRQEQHHF